MTMYTSKDIECKTVFVINCIEKKELHVKAGGLMLEDAEGKTLTKLPFQKILALFIIGNIHITTPLIDKCKKFNVSIIVTNTHFRPVFYWANEAEANYLLRQKQYCMDKENTTVAKVLVKNKIVNQISTLKKSRKTDDLTKYSLTYLNNLLIMVDNVEDVKKLMGLEGLASKVYFRAYFQKENWSGRKPRTKCDIVNSILDIGYTILFNYIECFVRMFGFDIYVGVFHRLWFKRKSLICDLVEPFRCIVDNATRSALHRKQFTKEDFDNKNGEYRLKVSENGKYAKVFFDALIPFKQDVFKYVQSYYRCFMKGADGTLYPIFRY
jgi:CRISPR-associated protein Cas1